VKVEDVSFDSDAPITHYWDQPKCPRILSDQWYRLTSPVPETYHMRRVSLHGNLSGLTITWCCITNISVHAHDKHLRLDNSPITDIDNMYDNKLLWIYFPLQDGEMISNFWVYTWLGASTAIAVRKNDPILFFLVNPVTYNAWKIANIWALRSEWSCHQPVPYRIIERQP
jgi:hypothetical protein